MSKYRKGSEAAAREKEIKTFRIIFTVLGVLVFMCNYIFNTDLQDFMQRAGFFWQGMGFIFHLVSIGWLWLSDEFIDGENQKIPMGGLWLLFMGLAIFFSTGFNFDYFGIK